MQVHYKYVRLYGYPVFALMLYFIMIIIDSDAENTLQLMLSHATDYIVEALFCLLFTITLFETGLWLSKLSNNKFHWYTNNAVRFSIQLILHIAILSVIILLFFTIELPKRYHYDDLTIRRALIFGTIFSILISTGFTAVQLFRNWTKSSLEAVEIKKQALQSELNALKLQLDPHFLFNNLNTLTSLIEENQSLAVKYVANLSAVYRYVLSNRHKNMIALSIELDFIEEYLFLYQIRYGDSIKIKISEDSLYMSRYMPPLTLQLLIENAIKHNSFSLSMPLVITIRYENECIIVHNNKAEKFVKEHSEGFGLEHIFHSYRLLGRSIIPEVHDLETTFEVRIPLLNNK